MQLLFGKNNCNEIRYDKEGNETVIERHISWICILFAILSVLSAINQTKMLLDQSELWKQIVGITLHIGGSLIFLSHCTKCQSWSGFWKAVLISIIASGIGASVGLTIPSSNNKGQTFGSNLPPS
tara:strand:+ start:1300 stop:1674 length:375 start_codon:yes stop_codon:yes gene_type:complete